MPADHRELGGRPARLGDFHSDFVRGVRLQIDSSVTVCRPAASVATNSVASAGAGTSSIQNRTPAGESSWTRIGPALETLISPCR